MVKKTRVDIFPHISPDRYDTLAAFQLWQMSRVRLSDPQHRMPPGMRLVPFSDLVQPGGSRRREEADRGGRGRGESPGFGRVLRIVTPLFWTGHYNSDPHQACRRV